MVAIRAAIWDFNGTIDNSEHIREKSIRVSLADFGRTFHESDYPTIMKLVGFDLPAGYISARYEIGNPQKFRKHWELRFREIFESDLALLPGVAQTISAMREKGLRLAIASSAYRDYIETSLQRLGIGDQFEAVVTRDDITGPGKPDPEAFRLAAETIGVHATNCVVVGDTESDLEGAIGAGMRMIYVPGWYELAISLKEGVTTLSSLENFNWNVVKQLEGQPVASRERAY